MALQEWISEEHLELSDGTGHSHLTSPFTSPVTVFVGKDGGGVAVFTHQLATHNPGLLARIMAAPEDTSTGFTELDAGASTAATSTLASSSAAPSSASSNITAIVRVASSTTAALRATLMFMVCPQPLAVPALDIALPNIDLVLSGASALGLQQATTDVLHEAACLLTVSPDCTPSSAMEAAPTTLPSLAEQAAAQTSQPSANHVQLLADLAATHGLDATLGLLAARVMAYNMHHGTWTTAVAVAAAASTPAAAGGASTSAGAGAGAGAGAASSSTLGVTAAETPGSTSTPSQGYVAITSLAQACEEFADAVAPKEQTEHLRPHM